MAFLLALLVRFRFETSTIDVQWYWTSLGLFAGVDIGYLYLRGMYDDGHVTADRTAVVVDGLVYATFLYLLVAYLVKNTLFSRLTLVYFLVLSFVLQVALERAIVAIRRRRYARGVDLVPAVIVGNVDDLASAGLDALSLQQGLGMRLLQTDGEIVTAGSSSGLEALLDSGTTRAVLLASPLPDTSQIVELCLRRYVTVYALGGTVRTLPYPSDVLFVDHTPVLRVRDLLVVGVGARVKRLMDVLLAGLGVVILSPLLLVLAALVKLTSRGPVLFGHRRLGEGGRPIRVFKFRSMTADAEACLQRPAGCRPVPLRGVRGDIQAEGRPPDNAAGTLAAPDIAGRTAPAVQRAPWRALAGGTASHRRGRDRQVWTCWCRHPPGSSRCHRPVAGQRAQRPGLRRARAPGHGLHHALEPLAGPAHPCGHDPGRPAQEGSPLTPKEKYSTGIMLQA